MFASPNIMFLSFIRRLTHSIFQFGLSFFFSCGTLAQITQHTKHLPRLDAHRGIAQHGGEPRPIFSPSFCPREFFCTETIVPEFMCGSLAFPLPPRVSAAFSLCRLLSMELLILFLQPDPCPMLWHCCQLWFQFVRLLLTATAAPSALEPDDFHLQALQGEAWGRMCAVPGGVGERLLDPHSEELLHLHHVLGIQNGTELYFCSLDVGKLG